MSKLLKEQAEWTKESGDWKTAGELYISSGEYRKAIELYGSKGAMNELIELCRMLDKTDHSDEIKLCA